METVLSTTVEPPRVRPGTAPTDHPLGLVPLTKLPSVLSLITGRSPVIMLPRKASGEPVTACECGGMLAYIGESWRHSDACLQCWDGPANAKGCPGRHVGCSQPEPRTCLHGNCNNVVLLGDGCAWDGERAACCNCCWERPDDPSYEVVSHKRR